MFMLGTSSLFGAVAHSVQSQLGDAFLRVVILIMNALSLISIYFCFLAAYTFFNLGKIPSKKYIYFVKAWIFILLLVSAVQGNFLLIKVHAGIVLFYALMVYYFVYRSNPERASGGVVVGILISFLPIVVHSLKISFHEWFNYKDIAHVIMIVSLIYIYRGARLISETLINETVLV